MCGGLASCVHTRSITYETTDRPPKPQDRLIGIVDSQTVTRPFTIIGVVEGNAGKLHSVVDTLENLKRAARRMGGDALMDIQHGPKGGVAVPFGSGYAYGNLREIWSAKVIIWQ